MSSSRTAWHPLFAALVMERAPPGFDVRVEVPLTLEPQRADLLLLRRGGGEVHDDQARVLRGLWPRIDRHAIVEFKSRARSLRRRDLARLLGYGWQYFTAHPDKLRRTWHLHLVLVVPSATLTLGKEVATLRLRLGLFQRGYASLDGAIFPVTVVRLDETAAAERDDLLALFARAKIQTQSARRWLQEHTMRTNDLANADLEGFDEIEQAYLESFSVEKRLAGLAPEQRLAGLAPEQRLAGLTPEQTLLALPIAILRTFPAAYVETLAEPIRREIQRRLAEAVGIDEPRRAGP